jgi:hypothetical protein
MHNNSMAGHYTSDDVGHLLKQANLLLDRSGTRTLLRVANGQRRRGHARSHTVQQQDRGPGFARQVLELRLRGPVDKGSHNGPTAARLVAQWREAAWMHDQDTALAEDLNLERHHVPWLRSLDRFHRDRVIECDKSPSVPNRKCKQIEIRQLPRSVNTRGIDPFLVD